MKYLTRLLLFICFSVSTCHATYNGYTYRRTITIDHTRVSTQTLTYTNFPVLVSTNDVTLSTTTGSGGHLATSTGLDIFFSTDSNATSRYGVAWDTETLQNVGVSTMNVWVNIPSISSTTDTVFYMFYGNSGVTSYLGVSTATWDVNYKLVSHLPNGTTLSGADSTSNCNGVVTNATALAGQIDGAADFTNTNRNVQYGGTTCGSSGGGAQGTLDFSTFTYSGWIKTSSVAGSEDIYNGNAGSLPQFFLNGANLFLNNANVTTIGSSPGVVPINTWTHVVVTYANAIAYTFYLNGALSGTGAGTQNFVDSGWGFGAHTWQIGNFNTGGNTLDVDQLEISNIVRSYGWEQTEYNSQNSPTTFLSIGAETTNSSGVNPQASFSLNGGKLRIINARVRID